MSGGVDSSTAAAMLSDEGYEVIGITMKTWEYSESGGRPGKVVGCCTLESINDARAVAMKFDFAHFIVDIRKEFGNWVVDEFTNEYLSGRTPNPCVLCNTHIKWTALMKRADDLGCEYIATGHYARLRRDRDTGRTVLMKGVDERKDQSYALWGVSQPNLARTRLPLGTFKKPEIRKMAAAFGLDRIADKRDSYEICFVPDNDYRRFLRDRVGGLQDEVAGGLFVTSDGSVVGRHDGYPFYTIGQRHGLGLALGHPVYVTNIDPETNVITVGPRDELLRHTLTAVRLNMIKYERLAAELPVVAKIRYNDHGAPGVAWQEGHDELRVAFSRPRRAIAPGQSVVLYEEDDVIGGGWIQHVDERSKNDLGRFIQLPTL